MNASTTDQLYEGPFPRKRHAHRCLRCGDKNATACYKTKCTKPRITRDCFWCRLKALRSLIDTDDDLTLERCWLLRETAASPDCTVITGELAAQICEQDPEGGVIKVVSYPVDLFEYSAHLQRDTQLYIPNKTKSSAVFTAWTPITWNESQERARLTKYENSEWRKNLRKREFCITKADELSDRMARAYGKTQKERFFKQVIAYAMKKGFDVEDFEKYISEVNSLIPEDTQL
jgi:hypothetical protein